MHSLEYFPIKTKLTRLSIDMSATRTGAIREESKAVVKDRKKIRDANKVDIFAILKTEISAIRTEINNANLSDSERAELFEMSLKLFLLSV